MSLKIIASLALAGTTYQVEGTSVAEVREAITQLRAADAEPTGQAVNGVGELGKSTKTAKKSAETEKPAASPSPAPETAKADMTASEAGQKSSSPTNSSTSSTPAVTDYLKTGISDKMASYLGEKPTVGYADRRATIVALLNSFNVKKGPELKPEQFAEFEAAITKLSAGNAGNADDDLG